MLTDHDIANGLHSIILQHGCFTSYTPVCTLLDVDGELVPADQYINIHVGCTGPSPVYSIICIVHRPLGRTVQNKYKKTNDSI